MRFHFVTIPIFDSGTVEAELNQFLGSHRVVSVERHLVPDGARTVWAICVTYAETPGPTKSVNDANTGKKGRIDYRETLSADQFQLFVKLRDWRKTTSDHEAVPPYAVFTNEQIAEMVRRPVRTVTDLGRIDGIGPSRVEKYGAAVLGILKAGLPVVESSKEPQHASA